MPSSGILACTTHKWHSFSLFVLIFSDLLSSCVVHAFIIIIWTKRNQTGIQSCRLKQILTTVCTFLILRFICNQKHEVTCGIYFTLLETSLLFQPLKGQDQNVSTCTLVVAVFVVLWKRKLNNDSQFRLKNVTIIKRGCH